MFRFVLVSLIPAVALSAPVVAQTPAPAPVQQTPQQAQNREFLLKQYPPGARSRREQGKVAFRLTIEPDGTLSSCEVTESSGFSGLDNETCEIVVRYGQLKPVMGPDGRPIRATQNGFINWKLPAEVASLAPAAPPPVGTKMEKPDEIICKKSAKTGSLIASTKQCMTRREWALTEQAVREQMENLQGRGNTQGN